MASARQREATNSCGKKTKNKQAQSLNFFLDFWCIHNVLVCWVASSLSVPLERNLKKWDSKTFVFLHIRDWCSTASLYIITHHSHSLKDTSHLLASAWWQREEHPLLHGPHMGTSSVWTSSFSMSFWTTTRVLDWLFGDSIRIYLFIYSILTFYEPSNYVTQTN